LSYTNDLRFDVTRTDVQWRPYEPGRLGHAIVTAGEAVPMSSRKTRIAFIIAALLLLVALCLHAVIWYRTRVIDWSVDANMGGLLVLMGTGSTICHVVC
jgi:hypothetical protein